MTEIDLRLGMYSHYETQADGWIVLWNVEQCDECEADCVGPDVARLRGMGALRFVATTLECHRDRPDVGESMYDEKSKRALCRHCYADQEYPP